jgi:hypothetical protein
MLGRIVPPKYHQPDADTRESGVPAWLRHRFRVPPRIGMHLSSENHNCSKGFAAVLVAYSVSHITFRIAKRVVRALLAVLQS